MPTLVIDTPDTAEFEQEASQELQSATTYEILTERDYGKACDELVRLKAVIDEAHARFDPIVEKAHEAHKEACRQRKIVLDPLEQANSILRSKVGNFLLRQQREKEERDRQALEAARRQAEEDREREIEHAET